MAEEIFTKSSLIKIIQFKNHYAELHDLQCRPIPGKLFVLYKFVMVVIPNGGDGKKMFIACETNSMALQDGNPPFLCIYSYYLGGSHRNYGASPDWFVLEKFVARAKSMICDELNECEDKDRNEDKVEENNRVGDSRYDPDFRKKWWKFWK